MRTEVHTSALDMYGGETGDDIGQNLRKVDDNLVTYMKRYDGKLDKL